MGLLDYVAPPHQKVAYLFPEPTGTGLSGTSTPATNTNLTPQGSLSKVFVFQFWPSQVTDSYTPNWATKQIPGASHPLYQWVSGSGRNISFTANFVSEVREDSFTLQSGTNTNFTSRMTAAGSGAISKAAGSAVGAAFLPSSRYTVNVAAALGALQQYLYPNYATEGITKPPRKLVLVLPGTRLGRSEGNDGILCIMKSANVTMESFFPSGEMRAASVSLSFAEIIQHTAGEGTNIRYIGSEAYDGLAQKYQINVGSPADLSF